MAYALLLAFIAIPAIEIALFIEAGGLIGVMPTLLAVLATAILGTALVRVQGLRTLQRARATLDAGEVPARELFDGVCILIGGVLLVVPGFFTDAIGLLLLIPPLRELLRRFAARHVTARATVMGGRPGAGPAAGRGPHGAAGSPWTRPTGPIIEGEYEVAPESGGQAGREPGRAVPGPRDDDRTP